MARGDQLARQWRIIQTLISSKHGKTIADLVNDENCHPRTIYRDLEALLKEFKHLSVEQGVRHNDLLEGAIRDLLVKCKSKADTEKL